MKILMKIMLTMVYTLPCFSYADCPEPASISGASNGFGGWVFRASDNKFTDSQAVNLGNASPVSVRLITVSVETNASGIASQVDCKYVPVFSDGKINFDRAITIPIISLPTQLALPFHSVESNGKEWKSQRSLFANGFEYYCQVYENLYSPNWDKPRACAFVFK